MFGFIFQLIYAIVIAVIVHSAQTVAEPDDDNSKINNNHNNERTNVTDETTSTDDEQSPNNESTAPTVPAVAVDLVQQENENSANETHDEKSTAKRTVNYHNQKFSAPIVVSDEGSGSDLFTAADDYSRKQINVQIIEPESHNNGQFLKETSYQRQENSTSITTTTSTERSINELRRSGNAQQSISNKFLAPIQAGLRLSNDERKANEDCDDEVEEIDGVLARRVGDRKQNSYVEIQKNTKIKKITIENQPPKKGSIFGSRFSTTTKAPCDQAAPCSTLRPPVVSPTRLRQPQNLVVSTIRQPQNLVVSTIRQPHNLVVSTMRQPQNVVVTSARPAISSVSSSVSSVHSVHSASAAVVTTPRTHVVQQPVFVHTHTEVPVERTRVVQQPVYVHTQTEVPVEKIVDRPVPYPVEKVVNQLVKVPYPVEVEKLVVKEVPVDRVVEKHINHAVAVDRPYPVEKVIEKLVHVPYVVEKIVDRPVEVEKIVTQQVHIPVDRVFEKIVDRPVEVERIVEKEVPVDRIVDRYIDRPVPVQVGVPVFVEVPVHSPYPVHVPVPYLVKPSPPPPPKRFFITKTTKYTKGHHLGLFDFKRHHKHVKHVIVKPPPPNIVSDEIIHSSEIDSIGLSPPPR